MTNDQIPMKEYKTIAGFTIIETLVAITILMVAIVGPLVAANNALTAALDSKNQLTAMNLAQEGMEYIKNQKDNNLVLYGSSGLLNTFNGSVCTQAMQCGVSANGVGNYTFNLCSNLSNCQLYIVTDGNGNSYYSYNSNGSGIATPFTRYYYVEPALNQCPNNSQCIVDVVVNWTTGTINNQVVLKDYLGSAQK